MKPMEKYEDIKNMNVRAAYSRLIEEIDNVDNSNETMLGVFVEMMDRVSVEPNYVVLGDDGPVLGVYLVIDCGDEKRESTVLPTSIPLKVA